MKARRFNRALSLLGSTSKRELVTDNVPIMTINDGGEMHPAILTTRDMRYIHCPPLVTPASSAHPATHPRSQRTEPLMHPPPLLLEHAIHHLLIHAPLRLVPQECPQVPVPEGRALLNQLTEPLDPGWIRNREASPNCHRQVCADLHGLAPKTRQLRRSEKPDGVPFKCRMSSALKGAVSTPPVRRRFRGPSPQFSASAS